MITVYILNLLEGASLLCAFFRPNTSNTFVLPSFLAVLDLDFDVIASPDARFCFLMVFGGLPNVFPWS